jgi:hypothetical protein
MDRALDMVGVARYFGGKGLADRLFDDGRR